MDSSISKVSMTRIFWRSFFTLTLFTIVLINYKQSLQYLTSFSIAKAFARFETSQILNFSVIGDLVYFLLIVLCIHLIWAAVITISCKPMMNNTNSSLTTQFWLFIIILHLTIILAANSLYYPTSLLGYFRGTVLASQVMVYIGGFTITLLFCYGLYLLNRSLIIATIVLASIVFIIPLVPTTDKIQSTLPNVIIIGIDGLRPDHLSYRDPSNELTPEINKFLSKSIIYKNSYTPLARTYVAWLSLLQGQYPKTHGARFNLAPPELVEKEIPLLDQLHSRGYISTYAMDERRFNQIDESYGFKNVIGPKIGVADVIISGYADLPQINLLVNTRLGEFLFPYLHVNRGYGKTYDPELFNKKVISSIDTSKPNFLAVHFCQLHWPYTSKDFIEPNPSEWTGNYNHFLYKEMLKKVDLQFSKLMIGLSNKGLLKDAIIYIISDHGEGFMLEKDKLHNPTLDLNKPLNLNAWGHGTNVLNSEQANIVLSYTRYKDEKLVEEPKIIDGTFSLVDIAPSIFRQLNIDSNPTYLNFDGQPLPLNEINVDEDKMVFVESSRSVKSVNASFIDNTKVLSETASSYEIREDGRAVMKPDLYKTLISSKQRAVYYKSWLLTIISDYDDIVLVDSEQKYWFNISSYDGEAPWKKMLVSLCNHYKDDEGFDVMGKCSSVDNQIN
ncbi:sulfatase-like hydrolase/transferase [Shewanella sp. KX20019]|uniref:sulfatase-like hydrolase/transferase n=1 Tax=Shewanella sp. KX20019 TaxID=2803864 RepID=UPI001927006D|nr:sulfatase-like hydrolase/transferase [Shewanella sp. KX20019]QQX82298.1 sulfatase-like hydrolase/transferase [Shewanella sp. KX20019]